MDVIVPLTGEHPVGDFSSGDPVRDAWLQRRALVNQLNGGSRTYILLLDGVLAGFYAIAVGSVLRGQLPGSLRRNAPGPVRAVILAQLAVSTLHQGRGLSRTLVLHAMGQALKVGDLAGCRLMIVHPADQGLISYCGRFGFTLVPATPAMMALSLGQVRTIWNAT